MWRTFKNALWNDIETGKLILCIAHGFNFECVAIFDILKDRKKITHDIYNVFIETEELFIMLFVMIKNLS